MRQTKTTIRFSAELFQSKTNVFLTLPKSVGKKILSQEMIKIEGIINSFPIQAALELDNKGSYTLKLTKAMRNGARANTGEMVTVEITRIGEELETRIPIELRKALAATPKAQSLWEDITPIARRDWIFWIISAKQEETRMRRVKVACSKLSSGMRRVCCFGGINWLMKNGQE